tara:strand:- start:1556 stop:1921 length:366 start_codon:yes stop_codon:yes gene_type:complete
MTMTKEQAEEMITLLKQLVDNSNKTDDGAARVPWTFRLLQEAGTGEDQDGNGLVYGHDFIFSHVSEWLPPDIQPTQERLSKRHAGDKLSILQYAESLDDDDPKIDAIYKYAEIKKNASLNG